MKLTDLAILFVAITLPFMLIHRIQSDNLQNVVYRSTLLNRYLDTAVEDAVEAMVVRGEGSHIILSREKAQKAFYQTLFTNFQILRSDRSKQLLSAYIPVIVLIDCDGYSVCSMEEYINGNGEKEQRMIWKPKKPYVYEREGYIFLFTLDRHAKVYDSTTNRFYEGTRKNLAFDIHVDIIQQDDLFEEVRKRTIIESMKRDVNEAINAHNAYASQFGITYQFTPPFISEGDWHRNIEDVGFLAFFQGLPMGLGGERYNHFALGAARIVRKKNYYIQKEPSERSYYHRETCSLLAQKDEPYDNREECALKGAFPCPVCNP